MVIGKKVKVVPLRSNMKTSEIIYPTPEHAEAAAFIIEHFSNNKYIKAILLTGSCARNKATKDSCLDIALLVKPEVYNKRKVELEEQWDPIYTKEIVIKKLESVGVYSHVDLDIIDGVFTQKYHSWTSGPDGFELEIGNYLAYSVLLFKRGDYLSKLKTRWLPYYSEELREKRKAMVIKYCKNNLKHIPLFVDRGLYFQAFDRLYNAYKEFLQALFITKRIYPIAYDKWIKEQLVEILNLKELYNTIVNLLEISPYESEEIKKKAQVVESLIKKYIDW